MTNYKIGSIYRIELLNNPDIRYIGSTFNRLSDRFRQHKQDYNKWLNNKHKHCSICLYFKQYGIEKFKIILIKEYEVVDRSHLEAYEQLYINKLKCVNINNTIKIKKMSDSEYYQNNKDTICEKTRNYNKLNKDKIAERAKDYYSNNKENINNYKKEWYENKKKEKSKKINCECGSIIAQYSLNKHKQSKKHLDAINS